jgi:antitoxin ParD1/3/4
LRAAFDGGCPRHARRRRTRAPSVLSCAFFSSQRMIKYDNCLLMGNMERVTITLTSEMVETVRGAISEGDYASTSEVVREALRDWQTKRYVRQQELETLRAGVRRGDADLAAERVRDFDPENIIRKGEERLAGRAPSE